MHQRITWKLPLEEVRYIEGRSFALFSCRSMYKYIRMLDARDLRDLQDTEDIEDNQDMQEICHGIDFKSTLIDCRCNIL
jgi:hypothetical protein